MSGEKIYGKVKSYVSDTGLEITAKDADGLRRISGYANKTTIDRTNELVEARAFHTTMTKFMNNPIMLLMHNSTQPIGIWDRYEVRADGLWVSGVIASGTKAAEEAWTLIEQRVLRSLSIGFREKEGSYVEEDSAYHITDLELLEVSVVSIPANADALFMVDKSGAVLSVKLLNDSPIRTAEGESGKETVANQAEALIQKLEGRVEALEAVITKNQELVQDTLAHVWGINDRIYVKENDNKIGSLVLEIQQLKNQLSDLEKTLVKMVKWEAKRVAEKAGISGIEKTLN